MRKLHRANTVYKHIGQQQKIIIRCTACNYPLFVGLPRGHRPSYKRCGQILVSGDARTLYIEGPIIRSALVVSIPGGQEDLQCPIGLWVEGVWGMGNELDITEHEQIFPLECVLTDFVPLGKCTCEDSASTAASLQYRLGVTT